MQDRRNFIVIILLYTIHKLIGKDKAFAHIFGDKAKFLLPAHRLFQLFVDGLSLGGYFHQQR